VRGKGGEGKEGEKKEKKKGHRARHFTKCSLKLVGKELHERKEGNGGKKRKKGEGGCCEIASRAGDATFGVFEVAGGVTSRIGEAGEGGGKKKEKGKGKILTLI